MVDIRCKLDDVGWSCIDRFYPNYFLYIFLLILGLMIWLVGQSIRTFWDPCLLLFLLLGQFKEWLVNWLAICKSNWGYLLQCCWVSRFEKACLEDDVFGYALKWIFKWTPLENFGPLFVDKILLFDWYVIVLIYCLFNRHLKRAARH